MSFVGISDVEQLIEIIMTKAQLFQIMDAVKMFGNASNKEIMYHLPPEVLAQISDLPAPLQPIVIKSEIVMLDKLLKEQSC
jgi:hypothetical protein